MRIAFATFGCKINQYETDGMQQAAAGDGNVVVPFDGQADVYVINTCSVTAKSDSQCRQAIRAAVRRGGGARVIVTGCYAETGWKEIQAIPGVSLVLPNREKSRLTSYVSSGGTSASAGPVADRSIPARTRAFLKIQDGCDARCSYCIVPFARGGSRSVPREDVVALFDRAVQRGAPEIVLSGIHVGRYGSDLAPATTLTELVGELLGRRGGARVRLSSIEPTEITPGLIGMVGNGLCRHLHIPIQSGDDGILRKMNRHYTAGAYREIVEDIAAKVPHIAIGADVIVGFPGEGEKEFRNTCDLIESLPITHLHVFSYSLRPGTTASRMPGQVTEQVKKERSEKMRGLALKKNRDFRGSLLGKVIPVVVERREGPSDDRFGGLTDNYLKVRVSGAKASDVGRTVNARLMTVLDQYDEAVVTEQYEL